jgi:tetratricopeptide (TPR) repeat protein
MYESGLIKEAKEILFSGAGITNGYPATIKAIAYMLESWKLFPEAIQVYGEILRKDSNDLSAWRNMALACYQDKQFQQCIKIFYNGIRRAWPGMDSTAINMKASMLQEMNAIIAVHRKDLDLSFIEPALIRPVNIDMGITVESNDQTYSRASLLDFKGKNVKDVISYNVMLPQEFQLKQASASKYKLRINYYGSYWSDEVYGIPSMIKTVVFIHPGQPHQSINIESVLMNNQSGFVDIGEWEMQ